MSLLKIITSSLPIVYKNNSNIASLQAVFNKAKQLRDSVVLINEDEDKLVSNILIIRGIDNRRYNLENKKLTIENVSGEFIIT